MKNSFKSLLGKCRQRQKLDKLYEKVPDRASGDWNKQISHVTLIKITGDLAANNKTLGWLLLDGRWTWDANRRRPFFKVNTASASEKWKLRKESRIYPSANDRVQKNTQNPFKTLIVLNFEPIPVHAGTWFPTHGYSQSFVILADGSPISPAGADSEIASAQHPRTNTTNHRTPKPSLTRTPRRSRDPRVASPM